MTASWRPMTEPERRAIQSLERVTFPVASPPKRLARHLLAQAQAAEPVITDRQADYLWRVVHTFRRQIPDDIRALAPQPEAAR